MYFFLKLTYKELLIIKHAIQLYRNRSGVSEMDRIQEEKALNKISEHIEKFEVKYQIKRKEKINPNKDECKIHAPAAAVE